MKDNNLKAIEELTGLLDLIDRAYFQKSRDDDFSLYYNGYNAALDLVKGYVNHRINRMERENQL